MPVKGERLGMSGHLMVIPDPTPQRKVEEWLHCLDETGGCPTPDLDKLIRIVRELLPLNNEVAACATSPYHVAMADKLIEMRWRRLLAIIEGE